MYRVISGTENDRCYNFGKADLPWATDAGYLPCTQYQDGGARKVPCTSDSFNPSSVLLRSEGPAKCRVYIDPDCGGHHDDGTPYDVTCASRDPRNYGYGAYKSFKCVVSSALAEFFPKYEA